MHVIVSKYTDQAKQRVTGLYLLNQVLIVAVFCVILLLEVCTVMI